MIKDRSRAEIAALVAERVLERDDWTVNGVKTAQPSAFKFMTTILPKFIRFQPPSSEELDKTFPVLDLNWVKLQNPPKDEIQITWLGHASVLVQMNGCNIVADPVFSERCSPSPWFGPKRYRPPPCTIADLCEKLTIDLVLISHNHYDHLDLSTIKELVQRTTADFVVPLGLKEWFRSHVSKTIDIFELDWHESFEFHSQSNKTLTISSVPMKHWSNRVGDRDKTLWCGYAVRSPTKNFLFPGDTGWFDAMADVGSTYGPFDLAAIPIGAYEPREFMKHQHVNVTEAVRMKEALQSKAAVPIHWGCWPLTIEPVMEPRETLVELMKERSDAKTFVPWLIGETKNF
jgi:N-acyl-phosphatidylethanolamine-hydrolysing phospholipase D